MDVGPHQLYKHQVSPLHQRVPAAGLNPKPHQMVGTGLLFYFPPFISLVMMDFGIQLLLLKTLSMARYHKITKPLATSAESQAPLLTSLIRICITMKSLGVHMFINLSEAPV